MGFSLQNKNRNADGLVVATFAAAGFVLTTTALCLDRFYALRNARLHVEATALSLAADSLAAHFTLELLNRTVNVVVAYCDLNGAKLVS